MLNAREEAAFVQWFSVWKTIAIESLMLIFAILPLLPGFSSNLRYTAIFYKYPFNIVLILSCAFLGLIFAAIFPLLLRAVRGLPAIEISGDKITVYGLIRRSVTRSRIINLEPPKFGSSIVQIAGERSLTLPMFLYKDSSASWKRLEAILGEKAAK